MFGTFAEKAIEAYAEMVREKKVMGKQGTEYADNHGLGEHDHSFLDTGGSQDKDSYAEFAGYDFGACLREQS